MTIVKNTRVRIFTMGIVRGMQPDKRYVRQPDGSIGPGALYQVELDDDSDNIYLARHELFPIDDEWVDKPENEWRSICVDLIRLGRDEDALKLLHEKTAKPTAPNAWWSRVIVGTATRLVGGYAGSTKQRVSIGNQGAWPAYLAHTPTQMESPEKCYLLPSNHRVEMYADELWAYCAKQGQTTEITYTILPDEVPKAVPL